MGRNNEVFSYGDSWLQFLISELRGARLQKAECFLGLFIFEFYRRGELYLCYFWQERRSQIFLLRDKPQETGPRKSHPLCLFIHSHFLNKYVSDMHLIEGDPRRFQVVFGHFGYWQISVIPGIPQLLAQNREGKRVSLLALREFPLCPEKNDIRECEEWNFDKEIERYLQTVAPPKQRESHPSPEDEFQKKKDKILSQIRHDEEEKHKLWMGFLAIEEKLSQAQSEQQAWELLKNFQGSITSLKGSRNPWDWFYLQKKTLYQKILRLKERVKEVENWTFDEWLKGKQLKSASTPKTKLSSFVSYRQHQFSFGLLRWGKSGEDNLRLLRESQPWDLWFHDAFQPGRFYILRRFKGAHVSSEQILQVCRWILKTEKKEFGEWVVCEVRFVTPIKGAKPGLVKFTQAKRYRVSAGL